MKIQEKTEQKKSWKSHILLFALKIEKKGWMPRLLSGIFIIYITAFTKKCNFRQIRVEKSMYCIALLCFRVKDYRRCCDRISKKSQRCDHFNLFCISNYSLIRITIVYGRINPKMYIKFSFLQRIWRLDVGKVEFQWK